MTHDTKVRILHTVCITQNNCKLQHSPARFLSIHTGRPIGICHMPLSIHTFCGPWTFPRETIFHSPHHAPPTHPRSIQHNYRRNSDPWEEGVEWRVGTGNGTSPNNLPHLFSSPAVVVIVFEADWFVHGDTQRLDAETQAGTDQAR